MKKELQDKLYEKYPEIFVQKDLSIQESCMPWGFECEDGWFWLIDNLCDCIQTYIDYNDKEQAEALQVKEKYGSLSFNISTMDEMIHGMVYLAESTSNSICEVCGSTEDVSQTQGWIKTLCDKCIKKRNGV
jgi:hypothetical protein